MKLVCVADVHLHPYRICSRDGGHDRLMDGLGALRQSLDDARELRAVWVMAGDFKMPKTSWPQSALTGALAILRDYDDVPKVMVAGNHDAEGIGGSGLSPFRDVATVVERAEIVTPVEGVELVCAPWNADLKAVRALINARAVHRRPVLVAHAFLQGCMLGPEDARIAKGVPVAEYGDFAVAIFGDVHKGQMREPATKTKPATWRGYPEGSGMGRAAVVRSAKPWGGEVFYCGSPYQQNWGERKDGMKGSLVVDLKTGEVQVRAIDAPRFYHLEFDEGGLRTFAETTVWQAYAENFVRIVYTGPPCAALDGVNQLADKFRSLQVVHRRPSAERLARVADMHAGMPMPELLRSYMAVRPPVDLDPDRTFEALMRLAEDPE
jgi:hypothetical protein